MDTFLKRFMKQLSSSSDTETTTSHQLDAIGYSLLWEPTSSVAYAIFRCNPARVDSVVKKIMTLQPGDCIVHSNCNAKYCPASGDIKLKKTVKERVIFQDRSV